MLSSSFARLAAARGVVSSSSLSRARTFPWSAFSRLIASTGVPLRLFGFATSASLLPVVPPAVMLEEAGLVLPLDGAIRVVLGRRADAVPAQVDEYLRVRPA